MRTCIKLLESSDTIQYITNLEAGNIAADFFSYNSTEKEFFRMGKHLRSLSTAGNPFMTSFRMRDSLYIIPHKVLKMWRD